MRKIYLITETDSHTSGQGSSDESTELCRLNLYGPFAPAFSTREKAQAYIDRDQALGIGKSKLWNPGITELKIS